MTWTDDSGQGPVNMIMNLWGQEKARNICDKLSDLSAFKDLILCTWFPNYIIALHGTIWLKTVAAQSIIIYHHLPVET